MRRRFVSIRAWLIGCLCLAATSPAMGQSRPWFLFEDNAQISDSQCEVFHAENASLVLINSTGEVVIVDGVDTVAANLGIDVDGNVVAGEGETFGFLAFADDADGFRSLFWVANNGVNLVSLDPLTLTPTVSDARPTDFANVVCDACDLWDQPLAVCNRAAEIDTQPSGGMFCIGNDVTLTVEASNVETYQWFVGGTAIEGATSATLTLENASVLNTGAYSVRVTGGGATVDSNTVTVLVEACDGPLEFCTGENFSLSASTLNLDGPLQWLRGFEEIAGATAATLSIADASRLDTGVYSIRSGTGDSAETFEIATVVVENCDTQQPTLCGTLGLSMIGLMLLGLAGLRLRR